MRMHQPGPLNLLKSQKMNTQKVYKNNQIFLRSFCNIKCFVYVFGVRTEPGVEASHTTQYQIELPY